MEFTSKLIRGKSRLISRSSTSKSLRLEERSGFTLIELIVVISIISIMSTLAFPSFTRSLRRAKFEKTVGEVVVLLEKARTQALASEMELRADGTYQIPPGGYGVYFDFTSFVPPALPTAQKAVLFVDDYNTPAGKVKVDYADEDFLSRVMPDGIYTSAAPPNGDSVIETVDINDLDYIQMTALKGDELSSGDPWGTDFAGDTISGNEVTVIFKPPYAETTIFGDGTAADADLKNFEVEFKLVTENICRQIKFNRVTTTPQIFKTPCL